MITNYVLHTRILTVRKIIPHSLCNSMGCLIEAALVGAAVAAEVAVDTAIVGAELAAE